MSSNMSSDVTSQGATTKAAGQKKSGPSSSKSQTRGLDSIQESLLGLGSWFEKNAVQAAAAFALLIVLGIGYGVWSWLDNRAELKAQDAYYAIEVKYTNLKEGFDRAKMAAFLPNDPKQNQGFQAASGDLNKDYGTIPAELETFAKDNAGTSAGTQAAILASNLYLTYEQPEKAAEVAAIGANALNKNRLLANLAKISWGSALADKGDCKTAINIWQEVLGNTKASSLHADVSLRAGLCYEALNEPTKARELYQKVISLENSSAASAAKGLLRALDLRSSVN